MPVVMDELVLERAPFTLHTAGARTHPAAHPHRRVMPTRLKQSVTLALQPSSSSFAHRHASIFPSGFEPSHLVLNAFRWIFLAPSYSWMFQLSNALTCAQIRALCIMLSSSKVQAALLFLNLVAVLVPCHRRKQYSVSSEKQN
jgi:hypothetical protein